MYIRMRNRRAKSRNQHTKPFAVILAFLLAFTLLPVTGAGSIAYADPVETNEAELGEEQAADITAEDTAGDVADDAAKPVAPEADAVLQNDGDSVEGLSAGALETLLAPLAAHALTSGTTGGSGLGTITLSASSASAGAIITVTPSPATTAYLAQLRYSVDGKLTYTAIKAQNGTYRFTMPDADVDVRADFVPKVWDGTIDVTWFDPAADTYTVYYPAQYAGLATIVNGLFTLYPTTPKLDANGNPVLDSRGPVLLPAPALFKQSMGVQAPSSDSPTDSIVASKLYGEFTQSYRINDSQDNYTRTALITKTARVIGEPAYIRADSSTGTTGEFNQVTTNDYWFGAYDFHDKTVYIGADLDFGGTQSNGVWNTLSPLFMPVGGQFSILPGAGDYTNGYSKLSSSWCGTLDGLGHRVTNVYAEYFANTEYGDSATIGFVGRMGVHDNDLADIRPVNPTVRQIVLESGYISGRRSTAGIVGKIGKTSKNNGDTSTGGIIEFCINKASITGTDAKGCAGIVAAGWNGGIVRYCANFGRINYRYSDPAGGIVGYNEIPIYNSYNVGLVTANADRFAMGIGSNNGGGTPIVNCYWLTGQSAGGGYYGGSAITDTVYEFGAGTGITELTAARLNGDASAPSVWYNDSTGINRFEGVNYPRLYFQTASFNPNTTYTVSVTQPATGGTVTASATSAHIADNIHLTATPAFGYMLDYFTVNGARISGADFALMGNVTVSAVFRELKQATLNIENTDSKPYTISIRKTGLMLQGGFMVNVTDASVSSGDTIYEGDVLTITAALKAGATPTDTNLVYSGQFTGSIAFGNVPVSWNASPFTVNATHLANAELGNGTAAVSAAPSTVAKDWLQVADVSWFDAASPQSSYTINSAAQLAGVAKIVNEGTHNFAGVTLTLAGNISLVNTDGTNGTRLWVPIGSATRSFTGIFDGSGREISGMSVVRTSGMYAGFFGNIEDATVLNLTVAGTVTSYQYGAGVVGYAKNSWIAGCINKASILAASSYTGGVVGALSASTALNCANEGTLGPTSSSVTLQYIGGVVGSADTGSVVRGCANKATVTGGYRVGGVVGNLASASAVTESSNTAAVVAEKSNSSNGVGGIVGNTAAGTQITKSFNSGSVSSAGGSNATYVGGLVGYMTSTALEDSYNRGAVTAIAGSVGGVVGRLSATASSASSIRRVYTTGTVTKGSLGNAGAITGYVNAAYNSYDKVYYLTGVLASGDVANGYLNNVGSSSISALAQSQTALKALTSTLGTAFKAGTASLNDGYPALVWQEPSGSSAGAPGSGDLNGDKTSTTQEAMTAARAAMGLLTLTPAQRVAMDMNGDGSLTMQDATRALRRSLGL